MAAVFPPDQKVHQKLRMQHKQRPTLTFEQENNGHSGLGDEKASLTCK